jgi:hypothetical protein
MTKARTVDHRVVNVATYGNATLRIALVDDGPAGRVLIISHGFGGGDEPFRRPDYCGPPIQVPASVLPELLVALEELKQ